MATRRTVEPLTQRQRDVLELLAQDLTNFEIAQRLGISLDGAKWHVREVLARLDVESREQAAEVWRHDRSLTGRGRSLLGVLARVTPTQAAIVLSTLAVAAVAAVATVGVVSLVSGGDPDSSPSAADSSPTPLSVSTPPPGADALSPRSGIPIVDEVIGIAQRGDLQAFRALMKEFPEPCTTGELGPGSPPACPPGAPDGTPVNTFHTSGGESVDSAADLDRILTNIVPNYTRLHVVAHSGRFPNTPSQSKYEVIVVPQLATGELDGAVYFLDDTGIVGLFAGDFLGLLEHLEDQQPDDWIIAHISEARLTADKDLYVLGRDQEIRFEATLPPVCAGRRVSIRLYEYPAPGLPGGIQPVREPGLASEASGPASASGPTALTFKLPAIVSTPLVVRLGLLSSCLSDIVVQGEVEFALLAPPEDSEVAIFEMPGKAFDVVTSPVGSPSQTIGSNLGGELTASVNGLACTTVSVVDPSARNARGNVVFRVGTAEQPAACRAPGAKVVFVMTNAGDSANPPALSDKPEYVPGTIRCMRNLGPEPPHREPRPPLIGLD